MSDSTSRAIADSLWASNGVNNPTVDRSIFNYGAALGAPKGNAEYDAFERTREALGTVAMAFSRRQWELEEAARAVRHAVTPTEQAEALAAYRVTFHAVDRALEHVAAGPLKWFRYGRVGEVLKSFNPFAKG